MDARKITVKPLTKEAFTPYGEVISKGGEHSIINQGTGKKWNELVHFDMSHENGTVNLGILRTMSIPLTFNQMERHLFTSQIFIPLGGKSSLVAVASANDKDPDPDTVEVFLMAGDQGVSFTRKVWHHTLFPLESDTDYILMMRGGFIGKDVEVVPFQNGVSFEIELCLDRRG